MFRRPRWSTSIWKRTLDRKKADKRRSMLWLATEHYPTIRRLRTHSDWLRKLSQHTLFGALGRHERESKRVTDGLTYTNDSISGYASSRQVATKIRQKFTFDFHLNFTPEISRGNKVFWFPGLIFSTTLRVFERELPENVRFQCQFMPLWAQNTKKFQKKINKNLNDLKLILLELDHFCSSKVWENRFFILHDRSWS